MPHLYPRFSQALFFYFYFCLFVCVCVCVCVCVRVIASSGGPPAYQSQPRPCLAAERRGWYDWSRLKHYDIRVAAHGCKLDLNFFAVVLIGYLPPALACTDHILQFWTALSTGVGLSTTQLESPHRQWRKG